MKEAKKLFLYLALGALFIVGVGMLYNKSQGKPVYGNLDLPFLQTPSPQTYQKVTLKDKEISVIVADDPNERRLGLSIYSSLPENEGMLFTLNSKNNNPKIFWMKDMKIAIDIIWIYNGKIVQIDKDARPEPGVKDANLKKYLYSGPVDYVVEVNSGWTSKNNISVGDSFSL